MLFAARAVVVFAFERLLAAARCFGAGDLVGLAEAVEARLAILGRDARAVGRFVMVAAGEVSLLCSSEVAGVSSDVSEVAESVADSSEVAGVSSGAPEFAGSSSGESAVS